MGLEAKKCAFRALQQVAGANESAGRSRAYDAVLLAAATHKMTPNVTATIERLTASPSSNPAMPSPKKGCKS